MRQTKDVNGGDRCACVYGRERETEVMVVMIGFGMRLRGGSVLIFGAIE